VIKYWFYWTLVGSARGQDYFRIVEGTCIIALCLSLLSFYLYSIRCIGLWTLFQNLNFNRFWTLNLVYKEEKVKTIQLPFLCFSHLHASLGHYSPTNRPWFSIFMFSIPFSSLTRNHLSSYFFSFYFNLNKWFSHISKKNLHDFVFWVWCCVVLRLVWLCLIYHLVVVLICFLLKDQMFNQWFERQHCRSEAWVFRSL